MKIKGLERENTVHPRMNQIVIVRKIHHQRTQTLTTDQEIKESILENNPVPSNFLSRQKLDDYLLKNLLEAGKKDEIFSDRSQMRT